MEGTVIKVNRSRTGDDFSIVNAEGDAQTQISQAEQAIGDGASVIVLTSNDSGSGATIIDLAKDAGVEVVRLPYRSPNLNAYAERFVRSIKDECLDRMIIFGERSLRKATREYAAHYHRERNHQGIDNRLIEPDANARSASDAVACSQRLGGMLRFYHRAAA